MELNVIKADVKDRHIKVDGHVAPTAGNRLHDVLEITLDEPWSGLDKRVTFYRDGVEITLDWDGESAITIPWEVLQESGSFGVTVVGSENGEDRLVTYAMSPSERVRVRLNGEDEGVEPSEPTIDIFHDIKDAAAKAEQAGQYATNAGNLATIAKNDAERAAEDVRAAAASGDFDGEDGRDGYSGVYVGASNTTPTDNANVWIKTDGEETRIETFFSCTYGTTTPQQIADALSRGLMPICDFTWPGESYPWRYMLASETSSTYRFSCQAYPANTYEIVCSKSTGAWSRSSITMQTAAATWASNDTKYPSTAAVDARLAAPSKMPALSDAEKLAARERIGIGEYELIESFDLAEQTDKVFRNVAPSGKSYNFSKIMIAINAPASSAVNGGSVCFNATGVDWNKLIGSGNMANTVAVKSVFVAEKNNNLLTCMDFISTGFATPGTMYGLYPYSYVDIKSVVIQMNSGKFLPSGTNIKIYGVWA